jgi:hypothetical protein
MEEARRERAQASAGQGSIDDRPEPLSSCRKWRRGAGAAAPTALNLSPESNRVEPSKSANLSSEPLLRYFVAAEASSAGHSPYSRSPAWQSLPVAGLPPANSPVSATGSAPALFRRERRFGNADSPVVRKA